MKTPTDIDTPAIIILMVKAKPSVTLSPMEVLNDPVTPIVPGVSIINPIMVYTIGFSLPLNHAYSREVVVNAMAVNNSLSNNDWEGRMMFLAKLWSGSYADTMYNCYRWVGVV